MKKWFLKSLILVSILILSGCGGLEGTVKDSNGNAISKADVTLTYKYKNKDKTKTTQTDEDGVYLIKKTPNSGTITITVSKELYLSQTKTAELSKQDVTVDFVLESEIEAPLYGTISGMIKGVDGGFIEGIKVSSGTTSSVTDTDGKYTLNVEVGAHVSVTVDSDIYTQNSRFIEVLENEISVLNMTVAKVDKIEIFDVSVGASITTKGATVELGASSIVNLDGSEYTGDVVAKVSFNQVTSVSGREVFPGEYIGLETNGEESVLQSYGFIDVTLQSSNGDKLKLADGEKATLTYPMDTNIDKQPDSIPLWYYDTQKGIWVEDGLAVLDTATNTYSGEVTHFTTWNLDAKVPRATYESCVEDVNGVRLPVSTIFLTTPGWSRTFTNNDANGEFKFINAPSGTDMSLRAKLGSEVSELREFTLIAGEDKVDTECLKVNLDASGLFYSVKGKVIYSDGTPMASRYIDILNNDNEYIGYARTDENGIFTSSTYERGSNTKITLRFNANIGGSYINVERTYNIDELNDVTNVGTIEIKATVVKGCVQRPDGSRDFSNGREEQPSAVASGDNHLSFSNPFAGWDADIGENGDFTFALEQNFQNTDIFAYADARTLTSEFSVFTDRNSVDLGNNCLVLEDAVDINKSVEASVTSSDEGVFLRVVKNTYADYEYPNTYGDEVLLGGSYWDYNEDTGEWIEIQTPKETSATFNLSTNGVYYVFQYRDDWNENTFDGTISITIDGVIHTVTIPDDAEAYEAWAGFAIEVYQGDIKIIELNKRASGGEA